MRRPGAAGEPWLALAPMDGVTDWVHRELITAVTAGRDSGVDLCVSEFVRVTAQPVPGRVLVRYCPELLTGGRTQGGVPVFVQLLGSDAVAMARTALEAVERGAPGIDLNFGCPAKRVNSHDGGASLLREPARIERVVAAVRAAVPDALPVSAKIRTGWADSTGIAALARAAERGGASWLVVHGRTRLQMYKPPADWEAIRRARDAISIPVVANGDIDGPQALRRCAEQSGCDAFMVGRAVLGWPALFRRLRGWADPAECGIDALVELLLRYVDRMGEAGISDHRALGRLKQWLCLGHKVRPELVACFERVKRCETLSTALSALVPVGERLSPAVASPARVPGPYRSTSSRSS